MDEKELRKLNRYQLLELLIEQTQRADRLEKEVESMRQQLDENDFSFSKLGSIAEASLQLNDVFVAAQKAADMYVEYAQKKATKIEEDAQEKADDLIREAKRIWLNPKDAEKK